MTFGGRAATQDALRAAALDDADADATMATASALARRLAVRRGAGLHMLVLTIGDDGIHRARSSVLGGCSFAFPIGKVKFWVSHSFTVQDLRSCLDAHKNLKLYKISNHIESCVTCIKY